MNSPKIEKILQKYFQGETSLAEERQLREFFRQEKLPPHLVELKDQFRMYDVAAAEELPESFDDDLFARIEQLNKSTRLSRRTVLIYVSSVAATVLILITLFIRFDPFTMAPSGTNPEAEEAFEQASKILFYVSGKFNQGATPLKKVARFDEGMQPMKNVKKFDDGVKKTAPVSRFNQVTNLITNPAP
ncbi:MAG TPA: hypothetical protein VK994_05230 [Bacteroidales bacterium]|nr:hypothetical protein [Bacteroidales bacterium]